MNWDIARLSLTDDAVVECFKATSGLFSAGTVSRLPYRGGRISGRANRVVICFAVCRQLVRLVAKPRRPPVFHQHNVGDAGVRLPRWN